MFINSPLLLLGCLFVQIHSDDRLPTNTWTIPCRGLHRDDQSHVRHFRFFYSYLHFQFFLYRISSEVMSSFCLNSILASLLYLPRSSVSISTCLTLFLTNSSLIPNYPTAWIFCQLTLKAKKLAPKPRSRLPDQGSANANAIECQGFRGDEEVRVFGSDVAANNHLESY